MNRKPPKKPFPCIKCGSVPEVNVRKLTSWEDRSSWEGLIECCGRTHRSKSRVDWDVHNRVVDLWDAESVRQLSYRLIESVFANLDQCPKPVADLAVDLRHRLGLGLPGGSSPS